jgi:hypothetical protein
MAQNNSVNVVNIDFENIKQSLRDYLSSQTTLKDYDYDGSVINTLLDVLAYNTHYQAFYSNMVANEMFLDSALLRPSVVSHAKNLGYTPSSVKASKALVDIILGSTAGSDTYLSRGTEFSGTNPQGTRFKFVNLDTVFVDAGATTMNEVELYEGTIRRITYIYNRDTRLGSYLIIPNTKADTTTLKVTVRKSITDTTGINDVWSDGSSYIDLDSSSKVYFLQEKEAGIYELYFGDGVLGMQPETGNVVSIEYLETNGLDGNGVTSLTKTGDAAISYIQFTPDPVTGSTASASFGGSDPESISSIKYNAPKFYQTNSRAVTEDDYSSIVYKLYPNASSVSVYGGETVTPPRYGEVFIAIKPKSGGFLTSGEKKTLERQIKTEYSVVTIVPKIVDPEYVDLVLDTNVIYNPTTTNTTVGTLKAMVLAYMFAYSVNKLEKFGNNFYYSNMVEGINGIHQGILGVYSKLKLRKSIDSSFILALKGGTLKFQNPIYHPYDGYTSALSSNIIPHKDVAGNSYTDTVLRDDGNGNIDVVRPDPDTDGNFITVYPSVGTVDYTTGEVVFNSKFVPNPAAIGSSVFPVVITVEPETTNIYSDENSIIRINPGYVDSLTVSLVTETQAETDNAVR